MRVDGAVLAMTLGVAVTAAIAFGVLPALPAAGARGGSLSDQLRGGQRGGVSRRHHRLRGALVTAEVALALMLLIGAGMLMQSFWRLRRVDPGWTPSNVLRVQFQLPITRYPQDYATFPMSWSRIIDFERDVSALSRKLQGQPRQLLLGKVGKREVDALAF